MTFKSRVSDRMACAVEEIERRAEKLPENLADARKAVSGVGARARDTVRQHPGLAVVGAFAIGYALAKLARHA